MFAPLLQTLRDRRPLVHAITNYVTANDCANLLLACGASPVMADDPDDAPQITAHAGGLVLNLGTLHRGTIPAMLACGRVAAQRGLPVVLDPVGVGASTLRTNTALQLLREVPIAVIRGNLSEVETLTRGHGGAPGVDSTQSITPDNLEGCGALARELARRTGAVVALTGAVDLVTDGDTLYCLHNGHPMMGSVTGTGCQLSCLVGAFAAANPDSLLSATAAAVSAMGLCGEIAHRRLGPEDGNGSYRTYLLDAVYRLTPDQLEKGARYELR